MCKLEVEIAEIGMLVSVVIFDPVHGYPIEIENTPRATTAAHRDVCAELLRKMLLT